MVKKSRVISVVKNIFDDKVKRTTINDLAGNDNRRKRKPNKRIKRKMK